MKSWYSDSKFRFAYWLLAGWLTFGLCAPLWADQESGSHEPSSCSAEVAKFVQLPEPYSIEGKELVSYVEGVGHVGELWRLNKQDYIQLANEERIPPDAILILDEIDLETDLPLVSGIILSKPLTLEGTHIQVLCKKMGIPLVTIPGAFHDSELIQRATLPKAYFSLSVEEGVASLAPHATRQLNRGPRRALPVDNPETLAATPLTMFSEDYESLQRELVGDKFFP
ncbi:MAG: hypothetical protein AAF202_02275, partial [Pseudomonadota bacterium]